jgi:UDP-GlcNAc:undecaprenyl-phosphate GlcNAc-1-phosphate transferase
LTGAPPFLVLAPLAFASALLLTPIVRRIAAATGYMDLPDPRKAHPEPTPLLGGVAVALALVLAPLLAKVLFGVSSTFPEPGVLAGGALSLGLGLLDDKRPMGPLGKLIGQLGAAACLVFWGPRVEWIESNPIALAGAILVVITLLNAVNFLDAMDGVVGVVLPIIAAGFALIEVLYGAPVSPVLAWSLVGASAGFLVYNAPPARIFLGDAGSHLLGFAIAALALQSLQGVPTVPHVASIALFLAYPMFDVVFVVLDRTLRGKPIYVGGVDHTTHRLGRMRGPWGTLAVIASMTSVSVLAGIKAWNLENPQPAIAAVLIFGLGYAIFGLYLRRIGPTPHFDI